MADYNIDSKNLYHDEVKETRNIVSNVSSDPDSSDMSRMGKEQQFKVCLVQFPTKHLMKLISHCSAFF